MGGDLKNFLEFVKPVGWDGTHFEVEVLLDQSAVRWQLREVAVAYVYILCRPNGVPFYVGKGSRNARVLDHVKEARNTKRLTHKLNVIRSMDRKGQAIRYSLEIHFKDESEALARERELIHHIGRHDLGRGPLTNQTDGGEGVSNPSEESRERRRATLAGEGADEDDRVLANRWFQKIVQVKSVPVKNIGKYKIEGLWRNRESFRMSERQAGALAASAIANRILLKPGAIIPRRMTVEGVEMIIENGVGRDMLSSNMAVLHRSDSVGFEELMLTDIGFHYIHSAIEKDLLLAAGVIQPENI